MPKINIIDLIRNPLWQQAVRSIRGESAHRLHNVLFFKFNDTGRFENRVDCNPKELLHLMGYKDSKDFRTARNKLVDLGLWDYHESNTYSHNGRKQGYFSIPTKFLSAQNLQEGDMPSSKKLTESNKKPLQEGDMPSSSDLQEGNMPSSKKPTESSKKPLQEGNMPSRVEGNMPSYIYRYIDRYIDDDDVAKIIKKFVQEEMPFGYKDELLKKQLQKSTSLYKKINDKKAVMEIADIICNTRIKKDVLNYFNRTMENYLKDKNKPRRTQNRVRPYAKRVEQGTDWSKKKGNTTPMTPEEKKKLEDFFHNLEKNTNLQNKDE